MQGQCNAPAPVSWSRPPAVRVAASGIDGCQLLSGRCTPRTMAWPGRPIPYMPSGQLQQLIDIHQTAGAHHSGRALLKHQTADPLLTDINHLMLSVAVPRAAFMLIGAVRHRERALCAKLRQPFELRAAFRRAQYTRLVKRARNSQNPPIASSYDTSLPVSLLHHQETHDAMQAPRCSRWILVRQWQVLTT